MSNTLGLFPSTTTTSLSSTIQSQNSASTMSTAVAGTSLTSTIHRPSSKSSGEAVGRLRPPSVTTSAASMSTNTTTTTSSSSPSAHLNHEDLYESLHSQVVDSMTKLASLPSNNLIGNPRVILPHNINTILTLAALQKQQKCSPGLPSPSSPPPPSSSSPSPVASSSSKMTPARLLSPSSSVLPVSGAVAPLSTTSLFRDHHGKSAPVDYARYVKRYFNKFSSALECGSNYCKDLNYREHFHCMDCNSRVFIKKEEMIRHFKWHKKRDESLQHGFLRYSPMDDCTDRFRNCPHNRKQTHYHCIKETCDKVYISTSDVQMHANYHRKDSAIIQEGFQRFRATEDCATSYCAFAGQRTTHFHCRRSNCNFTFKNKADMEKHKTYHIKDEQLNKDGFKKFMKHEPCSFDNCRFSRVCNHIHCIRQGCSYVLHSSGQLYSHKRKHERRDNEMAYRKFKLAQSMMRSLGENQLLALQSFNDELKGSESNQMHGGVPVLETPPAGMSLPLEPSSAHSLTPDSTTANYTEALQQSFAKYSSFLAASGGNMHLDPNLSPHGFLPGMDQFMMMDLNAEFLKARSEEIWKKYCSRFTANDPCKPHCDLIYKDHYHCNTESCCMVFRSKDGVRDHARCHEQQDQVTEAFFTTVDAGQTGVCFAHCPHKGKEKHYHCGWQNCLEVIVATDKPFRRLDHYKMHEYSHRMSMAKDPLGLSLASSAFDGIFKRKRGRPPKNRVVEFPISSGTSDLPQAIYTSFKLLKPNNVPVSSLMDKSTGVMPSTSGNTNVGPKPSLSPMASSSSTFGHLDIQTKVEIQDGFYVFPEGLACPSQPGCPYSGQLHYHCTRPRCFYVTDQNNILVMHSKDFHDNIEIAEGFAFFDRNVNCRLPGCQSNQVTRHFHCTRPHCNYSFVRYSTMSMHERKHQDMAAIDRFFNSGGGDDDDEDDDDDNNDNNIVDAATTAANRKPSVVQTTMTIKQEFPAAPTSPIASTPTPPTTMSDSRTPSPSGSSNGGKTSVVKAAGTYYPLSAFPNPYHTNKESGDKSTKLSVNAVATEIIKSEPPSAATGVAPDSIELRTLAESQVGDAMLSSKRSSPAHGCHAQSFLKRWGHSSRPKNEAEERHTPAYSQVDDIPSASTNASVSQPLSYSASFLATSASTATASSSANPVDLLHAFSVSMPSCYPSLLTRPQTINNSEDPPPGGGGGGGGGFCIQQRNGNPEFQHDSNLDSSSDSDRDDDGSSPVAGCKRSADALDDYVDAAKKVKMQASMRILKDEPVPTGYVRYRFNEDCRYTHCGYREHQTHFHCVRSDCGYSFCDKTRFVQHTARHERLDTLMGGDFQQFRANVPCGRPACVYTLAPGSLANKASHFHCLKCEFVCTDTNKVVAHRRQHQKLDSIMAAGFEKFTAVQPCQLDGCAYNQRQTHYHCTKCQYAVLGLSQMSSHKFRHLEG